MSYNDSFVLVGVLVLSAIAFVVSLAWNDAIKSIIDHYYPKKSDRDNYKGKLMYAGIVTVILIVSALAIGKYFPKVVEKSL